MTEVPAGELIQNATEKYNNMVSEKSSTKIYPKYDIILALTTRLLNLYKNKTFILETFQVGGGNINQTHTKPKVRDPRKSYVEGLKNLE